MTRPHRPQRSRPSMNRYVCFRWREAQALCCPRDGPLESVPQPPLHAFQDFGALILGQGPAHLEEEPPFWAMLEGMGDDEQSDTCLLRLFRHQQLMPQVAR